MIEAENDNQLEQIKGKIVKARQWALRYFNANLASAGSFVGPPSFFVDFPSPDTMVVSPSFMGIKSTLGVGYRLHFRKDGTLYWRTVHPLFATGKHAELNVIDPHVQAIRKLIQEQLLNGCPICGSKPMPHSVFCSDTCIDAFMKDDHEAVNKMYEAHGQRTPSTDDSNDLEYMNKAHAASHGLIYRQDDYSK